MLLPASVDGVVVDKALTFLQRAKHVELARLSDFEVGESFEDTMNRAGKSIEPEIAEELVKASTGYPFMIQLVGYYVWQAASRRNSDTVAAVDAEKGIRIARQSFDSMVIEPALRRLSPMQEKYLRALARCGEGPVASGDVAALMGLSTTEVGSYRKRLIDAALVEPCGYGKVDFAIPYMRDYLLRDEE